jgi:hypothetical protein
MEVDKNNIDSDDESILTDDIEIEEEEEIPQPTEEPKEKPTEAVSVVKPKRKKGPMSDEVIREREEAKEEAKRLRNEKKRNDRLLAKQEKLALQKADKVIVQQKEKVIYMLQNTDGSFEQFDPQEASKAQIKALNQEKKNIKVELELGQKLPRLLNGKAKVPRERTEKQKAQTAILVARNKARAEQKRLTKKAEEDLSVQESVKRAVKDVLKKPKKEIQEEIIQPVKKFQYF